MPWKIENVDGFKKGLSEKQKELWVEVANDALERCLKAGGTEKECDASAIRQANSVAGESEREVLGDKILEAIFDEGATFKATLLGFLKAAQAVTRHKSIPSNVKKQVDELRALIATNKWADLANETAAESKGDTAPLFERGTIVTDFSEQGSFVKAGDEDE
jgi:hypothetical protein